MVPWTRVEAVGWPGSSTPGSSAPRSSPLSFPLCKFQSLQPLNFTGCRLCFGVAAFLAQILVPAEGGEGQLGSQAQAVKSPGEQKGHPGLLGETESNSDSASRFFPEAGGLRAALRRLGWIHLCVPEPSTCQVR